MCGIFALYDPITKPTKEVVAKIVSTMAHRGPDAEGIYCEGPVALGHSRLSIIDIEGGEQPLWNEDATLALICNGEIYDYSTWRKELETKGHIFKSHSDSEVLLHLYEERGVEAFEKINGMFAVVLYEVATQSIIVARDRYGQKPLYYAHNTTQFSCASGPRQLSMLPWVDTGLNYSALNWYLQYQYFPEPNSIYAGIQKLPAGSYGIFKGNEFSISSYVTPSSISEFEGSFEHACTRAEELLQNAVQRRLVSDVPLGIFLSGGLDSSLIAALASKQRSTPIDTFSIGFSEAKYDERHHAQRVANHIGSNHHFLEVNPNSWDTLIDASTKFEEPFADSSLLPTLLLSEFAQKKVSVALGGDGADELAGGYYRYQVMRYAQGVDIIPQKLRSLICGTLGAVLPKRTEERTFFGRIQRVLDITKASKQQRYLELISRFKYNQRKELYNDILLDQMHDDLTPLASFNPTIDIRQALMQLDLQTYLPNDILVKVDRASMAHSLEVRAPFLDKDFSAFMRSLPVSYTAHPLHRKRILEHLGKKLLPPEISTRRKMGFGVPLARWYRNEWFSKTNELLLDSPILKELFKEKALLNLLHSHAKMKTDNSYQLFALTMLALWGEQR